MSPRRLAALHAQAAAMRQQGAALKADIAAVLAAHTGRRLKAYAVLTYLKRDPLPSLRRVQEILREFRTNNGSAHVNGVAPLTLAHRETHAV